MERLEDSNRPPGRPVRLRCTELDHCRGTRDLHFLLTRTIALEGRRVSSTLLQLAFLVFFDALLRPFMSAVLALVIVLKFLNVDNCGRAFVNGGHWAESFNATSSDSMRRTSPPDKLWTSALLPFHANKSLVLKLDMKSASTLQAAPEELHFYLIPFSPFFCLSQAMFSSISLLTAADLPLPPHFLPGTGDAEPSIPKT